MIAALIAILFLGGGIQDDVLNYVNDIRGSLSDVVDDDDRRAEAKTTLNQMKKITKQRSKSAESALKDLLVQMGDYESSEANIDAIWDGFFESVQAYNIEVIDLRFELKDSLTREEWEALFGSN